MKVNGRPRHSEEKYKHWLEDMKPFLKIGNSLRVAMMKAGLDTHSTSIYRKYNLRDWFAQGIDLYQNYLNKTYPTINTAHQRAEQGFVYLIVSEKDFNIYKIGCTDNIQNRLRHLNINYYFDLALINSMRTRKKEFHEEYLHKHFKDKKIKGEWYNLSMSDVEFIQHYFIKHNE